MVSTAAIAIARRCGQEAVEHEEAPLGIAPQLPPNPPNLPQFNEAFPNVTVAPNAEANITVNAAPTAANEGEALSIDNGDVMLMIAI